MLKYYYNKIKLSSKNNLQDRLPKKNTATMPNHGVYIPTFFGNFHVCKYPLHQLLFPEDIDHSAHALIP